MSDSSSSAVKRILASEEIHDEEIKKFNTERTITLALAPDAWTEFKRAIKDRFGSISQQSRKFIFECEESDENLFTIFRYHGDTAVPVAKFLFNLDIPAIRFEYQRLQNTIVGTLRLTLCGNSLLFTEQNRGIALPDFLAHLMVDLTR